MYSASLRNHGFFGLNSPYLCAQIKVDFETDHESQNQIIFYVVRDLLAWFNLNPLLKQVRLMRTFLNLEDLQGGRFHSFSK